MFSVKLESLRRSAWRSASFFRRTRRYSRHSPRYNDDPQSSLQALQNIKTSGLLERLSIEKVQAEAYNSTIDDQTSSPSSKIVHFQRHGQGYHNLIYRILKDHGSPIPDIYDPDPSVNPFMRPEMVDPPLTAEGRSQCLARRSSSLRPEIVLVSPLHRTLQTALLTFGNQTLTNDIDCNDNDLPFVAHEDLREGLGLLSCNRRHRLSMTQADYPTVDFSLLHEEEDTLFDPHARESLDSKTIRIHRFLQYLLHERPEREMAVVGHSEWLFHLTNVLLDCDEDDHDLKSWFAVSEIRSMRLHLPVHPQ